MKGIRPDKRPRLIRRSPYSEPGPFRQLQRRLRRMKHRDVLFGALRAIRFRPNELAYLALTSKPELQVRDRLGYILFQRGPVAARE